MIGIDIFKGEIKGASKLRRNNQTIDGLCAAKNHVEKKMININAITVNTPSITRQSGYFFFFILYFFSQHTGRYNSRAKNLEHSQPGVATKK